MEQEIERLEIDLDKKIDAVNNMKDVWFNRGVSPEYHERAKEELKKNWPMLYKAVEKVIAS